MKKIEEKIKEYNSLRRKIFEDIFKEYIKPVLDKENWGLEWANGIVVFKDENNNIIYDEKRDNSIRKMQRKYDSILSCMGYMRYSLWDVMSEIYSSGSYHQGLMKGENDYERLIT